MKRTQISVQMQGPLVMLLLVIVLLLPQRATAAQSSANFRIEAEVVDSGGGDASSPNFANQSAVGQTAIGDSSELAYIVHAGFWNDWTADFLAPVTNANGGGYSFGSWTAAGAVTFTLQSTDTGAGIATGYPKYCVDANNSCTPTTSYSGPADVTCSAGSTCTSYLRYFAMDNLGNAEVVTSVVVNQDLQAPTVLISSPSASATSAGPVTFTVTYMDQNFSASTLAVGNITVQKTGTANGTVSVDAGTGATRTVTISGITGNGTLGISIAAGTASDSVGNLAAAAGPSTTLLASNNVTQYALSITKRGSGLVTSSTGSISCGSTCSASYNDGTVLTLIPTPDTGWNFVKWEGDADCSDGSVTMTSARSCKAVFAAPAKIGVFIDGYWYLDANMSWDWNGTPPDTLGVFGIGLTGAIPVAGDWNGDGKTEIGVYINGEWYLDMNGNWQWDGEGVDVHGVFGIGVPNAIPVVGDWTGDGVSKIGIYSNGYWYLDVNSSWAWEGEPTDTFGIFGIGLANAVPVTGDWNGDGKTEIGIYSDGYWYLDKNQSWAWEGEPTDTFGVFGIGVQNAVAVTGDWNGDGITKIGIYSDGLWYLDRNASWAWDGTPTDTFGQFGLGLTGAVPVTGNW